MLVHLCEIRKAFTIDNPRKQMELYFLAPQKLGKK